VKAIAGSTDLFSSGQWSQPVDFQVTTADSRGNDGLTDLPQLLAYDDAPVTENNANQNRYKEDSETNHAEESLDNVVAKFEQATGPEIDDWEMLLLDEWMANPEQVARLIMG
jgi:hypothetical protein